MTKPSSFFDREVTIKNHSQMMAKLAERTSGRGGEVNPSEPPSVVASPSTASAGMPWDAPVKATQTSSDGRYQIRRIETKGVMLYWTWAELKPVPKLLGYPATAEAARALAQAHSDADARQKHS